MSQFLAADYRKLVPYTPGEQLNDRPIYQIKYQRITLSPVAAGAEGAGAGQRRGLNLYSDPTLAELTGAIAERFGLSRNQVFCGNGSDDVLAFSIMAFCGRAESWPARISAIAFTLCLPACLACG